MDKVDLHNIKQVVLMLWLIGVFRAEHIPGAHGGDRLALHMPVLGYVASKIFSF